MTERTVSIVRTGIANTASVAAAVRRAGRTPRITDESDPLRKDRHVILPGVGSFGAGVSTLRENDQFEPLRDRIDGGKPLLCICLGLQLLCGESEESPGATGLGVVDRTVRRFPSSVRIPQFGWNETDARSSCRFMASGYAYFANSYLLPEIPPGWTGATAEYGRTFVAALERDPLLACQFHLELSGPWGQNLLERWLSSTG